MTFSPTPMFTTICLGDIALPSHPIHTLLECLPRPLLLGMKRGGQSRERTEEAVARAETAPFALWGVLGLSGWDEQVALYTEHKAVRCREVRNDAPS